MRQKRKKKKTKKFTGYGLSFYSRPVGFDENKTVSSHLKARKKQRTPRDGKRDFERNRSLDGLSPRNKERETSWDYKGI
jgi:hypothetical protein